MGTILIVDDDKMMCKAMSFFIQEMGHRATLVHTLKEGLEKASEGPFDLVLLDVCLPDGSGLDILPQIKESVGKPEILIITAAGDPDGAEAAIRNGAWDYIQKPSSVKELMLPLNRAFQFRKEKLAQIPTVALKREKIVGSSPAMKACINLLAQAVLSDANVLISGETGTGKELFARAIHSNRPRGPHGDMEANINGNMKPARKSFVVVDCAALPETLVESVLFGHEKGSFTGADKTSTGLIKQADGGTLFLDEVGELPLTVQKAFLRVLQERRFRPVGGKTEIKSKFRLIAATNRNLEAMAKEGEFRSDLLFRLRALNIGLPPLRERIGDIKELTRHHLGRLCDQYSMATKGFSPEFLDTLMAYDWPGNVRELVNAMDSALAMAGHNPTLFSYHLPVQIRVQAARIAMSQDNCKEQGLAAGSDPAADFPTLKEFRNSQEKEYLQNLISLTKRDIKKVCWLSGISRSRLYELLAKYDLSASAQGPEQNPS